MRPNKVALKYLDLKKNVDPNVHVKVFNSAMKANAKTFEEYHQCVELYAKRFNIELVS